MPSVFYLPTMKMMFLSLMLLEDLWMKLMSDEVSKKKEKKQTENPDVSTSSFLDSVVLPNYENRQQMARLLFDSLHKQFCENAV